MRFHREEDDFTPQQDNGGDLPDGDVPGGDLPEPEEGTSFFWGLMGVLGVALLILVIFAVVVGVFVAASHGLGLLLARVLPLTVEDATLLALLGAVGVFVSVSLVFILVTLGGCHSELGRIAMDSQEFNSRLHAIFEPLERLQEEDEDEEGLAPPRRKSRLN